MTNTQDIALHIFSTKLYTKPTLPDLAALFSPVKFNKDTAFKIKDR